MRYLSLNSFNYNIIMARFLDPTYDPRQDSGTSGGDTSDLHPERAYDTDIRRLDETARDSADAADTRNEVKQDRVKNTWQQLKLLELTDNVLRLQNLLSVARLREAKPSSMVFSYQALETLSVPPEVRTTHVSPADTLVPSGVSRPG
jgi:hypothetical protein